jgi:hypothetical protein
VLPEFTRFIEIFLKEGLESERNVQMVLNQISQALHKGFGRLWIYREGSKMIGYLYAEGVDTDHNTKAVLVQQTYVEPGHRPNIWQQVQDVLVGFGREIEASEMYFMTRRNPKAFLRLFPKGWEFDCYVLRRHL